jgi:hypothetical protein
VVGGSARGAAADPRAHARIIFGLSLADFRRAAVDPVIPGLDYRGSGLCHVAMTKDLRPDPDVIGRRCAT